MNPFRRIDDFTFDRIFQPIVDRFPDAGPAGVARFFLTGNMVLIAADHAMAVPHEYGGFVICLLILTWLYIITRNPRIGMRNPERIRTGHKLARLSSWVFLAFDAFTIGMSWHSLSEFADSILFTSYWYSSACDKLPPPRKASVWERRRVVA